jgi:hypothetical protein
MAIESIVLSDLIEATQNILDLGNAEDFFSIDEVLRVVFKFYGAVITAVLYCVITPEEASRLHYWLVSMFELNN